MLNPQPPESTRKNRNKRKRLVATMISTQSSEKLPRAGYVQHLAHASREFHISQSSKNNVILSEAKDLRTGGCHCTEPLGGGWQ